MAVPLFPGPSPRDARGFGFSSRIRLPLPAEPSSRSFACRFTPAGRCLPLRPGREQLVEQLVSSGHKHLLMRQKHGRLSGRTAHELVKERGHSKPFGVLAHRAKEAMEVGKDLDVTQVAAEESQATPARQRVGSDLDGVEAGRGKLARGERGGHDEFAPFGLRAVADRRWT